jgi:hypothetical protein
MKITKFLKRKADELEKKCDELLEQILDMPEGQQKEKLFNIVMDNLYFAKRLKKGKTHDVVT